MSSVKFSLIVKLITVALWAGETNNLSMRYIFIQLLGISQPEWTMPPINQNEHWPQTTIMAVELICADFNFISSVSHGLSSEQIEVNVTLKERTESEMSPDFQEENRITLTKRKTNG